MGFLISFITETDITGLVLIIFLIGLVLINVFVPAWLTWVNREKSSDQDSENQEDLKSLKDGNKIKYIWYAGLAGSKIKGDLDYFDLHDELDSRGETEKDIFPEFSQNYGFILRTKDNTGNKVTIHGEVICNDRSISGRQKQHIIFLGNMICNGKLIHRIRTIDGDICPNQIS